MMAGVHHAAHAGRHRHAERVDHLVMAGRRMTYEPSASLDASSPSNCATAGVEPTIVASTSWTLSDRAADFARPVPLPVFFAAMPLSRVIPGNITLISAF